MNVCSKEGLHLSLKPTRDLCRESVLLREQDFDFEGSTTLTQED